jgi:hypothetical protein
MVTNNPDKISAQVLTGSRDIDVKLCATARYYP